MQSGIERDNSLTLAQLIIDNYAYDDDEPQKQSHHPHKKGRKLRQRTKRLRLCIRPVLFCLQAQCGALLVHGQSGLRKNNNSTTTGVEEGYSGKADTCCAWQKWSCLKEVNASTTTGVGETSSTRA